MSDDAFALKVLKVLQHHLSLRSEEQDDYGYGGSRDRSTRIDLVWTQGYDEVVLDSISINREGSNDV